MYFSLNMLLDYTHVVIYIYIVWINKIVVYEIESKHTEKMMRCIIIVLDQKTKEKERHIELFNHDMKNKGKKHQVFDLDKLVFILKSDFESDHDKEDDLYSSNQDQKEI